MALSRCLMRSEPRRLSLLPDSRARQAPPQSVVTAPSTGAERCHHDFGAIPVHDTTSRSPHGDTQVEVRIMYVWPEKSELTPVLPLIRMGRGKMMGVDHNRNLEWVGSSAGLIAE